MDVTDPRALLVAREQLDRRYGAIASNIGVVNALFDALLRSDEIPAEAMQSYYVDALFAQVQNGGFSQFVYNTRWSSAVTDRIREGLGAMGATRQLAMFEDGAAFLARAGDAWLASY